MSQNDEQSFGKKNVSETINKISSDLEHTLSEMEVLLTLPLDYIKSTMSHDDFMKYISLREKTLHTLELLEVFVYDTHENAQVCFECGETIPKIKRVRINGHECEKVNGEIEHWVNNGKIQHIFICDDCLKRAREQ